MNRTLQLKAATILLRADEVIRYSASQRALIWEHWRKGETLHQIARSLTDTIRRSNASWRSRAGYAQASGADRDWH